MASRNKCAGYSGVYFSETPSLLEPGKTERIYYIVYRPGGRETKQIEERLGRSSQGWTPARAANERGMRMAGKTQSNSERREAAAAKRREEEAQANRPTLSRLFMLYNEARPDGKTKGNDQNRFTNHLQKLFGDKVPAEITIADIDRLTVQKSKSLAPATVSHILELLNRIINYGIEKRLCKRPDFVIKKPRIDNQRTENLTREQMTAYLEALDAEPDQSAVALIRLILSTGIRRGAAFALKWADIDFERGFITLRGESAKSGKTERIPMSDAARAVLEKVEHVAGSEYVFPGRGGGKRVDFKKIPLRVRNRAGLPEDFRPLHGLRHTFASWMASTGSVDLYTLQKLLTHNSTAMTQRYAHLADEALQRAASVAGDVFRAVAGEKARVHQFRADGTDGN